MEPTPEPELTPEQKRREFRNGAVLIVAVNLIFLAVYLSTLLLIKSFDLACCGLGLPWAVNPALLGYLAMKRKWMGLGGATAIGLGLAIALVASILYAGACFVARPEWPYLGG